MILQFTIYKYNNYHTYTYTNKIMIINIEYFKDISNSYINGRHHQQTIYSYIRYLFNCIKKKYLQYHIY